MNRWTSTLLAGASGSLTTNVLHEIARRTVPDAPRVDILGMQALAKSADALDAQPPVGKALYASTLAADLVSNSAYFALVGLAQRGQALWAGLALGIAAGIGAVTLPARMGLATLPTNRTARTKAITVALYGCGGFVAGYLQDRLAPAAD